ncbi:MAG: hypothetical protein DRQ78_11590 [Epsilonproteobacteria bacterium]|nr:MAG: hypothetical protein DRQ78_11590 [Campylobacterota bacterium]
MINEYIIDEQNQKSRNTSLSIAKVLMTLAVYLITSATLLEYFSAIVTLKTLGFMLFGQAIYFLYKSNALN